MRDVAVNIARGRRRYIGACMAYHVGHRDEAKRLICMIDTEDRANRVFQEMIRTRLAFPTFDGIAF